LPRVQSIVARCSASGSVIPVAIAGPAQSVKSSSWWDAYPRADYHGRESQWQSLALDLSLGAGRSRLKSLKRKKKKVAERVGFEKGTPVYKTGMVYQHTPTI
jgi:hypothetical protein